MAKLKEKFSKPLLQLYDINKNFICNLSNRNLRNSAYSIKKKLTTNDVKTLTFMIPFDNEYIHNNSCEYWVKFEFDWYIIKTITLASEEITTLEVYCEDEFSISKSVLCEPLELIGCSPKEMFDGIMGSTGDITLDYKFKGTDIASYRSIVTEGEISVFENLIKMAEAFTGVLEMSTDKYGQKWIFLRKNPYDRGKVVRKDSDVTSLTIEYNTSEIFTRLMPFGEQDEYGLEVNIGDVNPTGKLYIENYSYYKEKGMTDEEIANNPQCKAMTVRNYENITDPAELLSVATEDLNNICKPTVTGDLSFYDLSVLEDSSMIEPLIYEKLIVVDAKTKMRFESIIQEIEYDYDNPIESSITLNNTITYNSVFKDLVTQGEKVDKITTTNPSTGETTVIGSVIQGKINTAVVQISNMLDTIESPESVYAILFEDRRIGSALYGALAIGTSGILIAHELKEDNTWNWATAINSLGVNASEVVTGTLWADIIKAGTLSDVNNTSWFNLEDGTFSYANGALSYDGDKFEVLIGGKSIEEIVNSTILTVLPNRESCIIVLDEDGTPSKNNEIPFEFKVYKNNSTEEVPCVIKDVVSSSDNVTTEWSNTKNTVILKANTNTVFTDTEGYLEVTVETTIGDIKKFVYWNTIINTIEAPILILTSSTQTFTRANLLVNYEPESIDIVAQCSRCEVSNWKYSIDNGNTFINIDNSTNGITINGTRLTIVNNSKLFDTTKTVIIKAESEEGVSDCITISRVEDNDMVYVMLSNENHTFGAESDGYAIPDSTTIEVYGYKGTEEATVTIGTITGLPTGMSAKISKNVITISVTNKMKTLSGTLTIPITCEKVTFNKKFSYSLSVKGTTPNFNLITNSAFLDGIEGWNLGTNVVLDETVTKDGHPSIKSSQTGLTSNGLNGCSTYYVPNNPTAYKSGETLVVSCYYYVEDSSDIDQGIRLDLRGFKKGDSNTDVTIINSIVVPKEDIVVGQWIRIYMTITLLEDFPKIGLKACVVRNGTAWFTDFKLERDNLTPWLPTVEELNGADGESVVLVDLTPSALVFKKKDEIYTPNTIKLTPKFTNSVLSKYQYSIDGGTTYLDVTSGSNGLTIKNNILTIKNTCDLYTDTVTSISFKIIALEENSLDEVITEVSDVVTITKIQDGEDGFTVILDNESHTFVGNYEGYAMSSTINISPVGYVGVEKVPIKIGTITGKPKGMNGSISNNNTTTPVIKITVKTTMTSRNGILSIPITATYNGKTYSATKLFSYSLSLDGTPASSVKIVGASNSFLSGDGGKTYTPSSLTFSGTFIECNFNKWQYWDTDSETYKDVISGALGVTLSNQNLIIVNTSHLFATQGGSVTFRLLSDVEGVYDMITVNKFTQVDNIGEEIENIKSDIQQTNSEWRAEFTMSNTSNMLFDGDFNLPLDESYWYPINAKSTIALNTINAYPFYENHQSLATAFKYNTECGVAYGIDLELNPNTDYVYQAYIYTDNVNIDVSDNMPLTLWAWTGNSPTSSETEESIEIIDYSQIIEVGRYDLCYIHFKTKDINATIKCRLFIKGKVNKNDGNNANLSIRQVCFRQRSIVGRYEPNANEVNAGITTINMDGITVEHTAVGTKTQMKADGLFIVDSSGEVIAELSNAEQWSQLKADRVFAENIENVYMGTNDIYVDHSYVGDSDGSQEKPWSSFADLNNALKRTRIINKSITINLVTTGDIPEPLILSELKGDGQININLNAKATFQGGAKREAGIRLVNITVPRVIIRGASKFNQFVHGCYITNCRYVDLQDSIYLSDDNGYGFVADNSNARINIVDFTNSYTAICAREGSKIFVESASGNGHCFRVITGGIIIYGDSGSTSIPYGSALKEGGIIQKGGDGEVTPTKSWNYPSDVDTIATVPSTMTYAGNFNATGKKSYSYSSNNWSDSDCKQGSWGYGLRGGHMFFDMTAIRSFLSGTIQDGNTITLTRANSGGIRGGVKIYVNGSSCSSASGTPSYGGQTLLGTLAWGETKTFTLPKAIVEGLKNGSYNSLAFYVNSNANDCYANITACNITLKCNK